MTLLGFIRAAAGTRMPPEGWIAFPCAWGPHCALRPLARGRLGCPSSDCGHCAAEGGGQTPAGASASASSGGAPWGRVGASLVAQTVENLPAFALWGCPTSGTAGSHGNSVRNS